MIKFKVGCYYVMRSPCDHECIWVYKVISRTAKTITLYDGETTSRFRISKASEETSTAAEGVAVQAQEMSLRGEELLSRIARFKLQAQKGGGLVPAPDKGRR